MWIYRLLEGSTAGLCAAILLVAILDRRDLGAATCVAVTATYVYRYRPTAAAAAAMIDRRFGWNELVQSACTPSNGNDMAAAVMAVADARCAAARTRDVPVGRFGHRHAIAAVLSVLVAGALWIAPHGSHDSAAGESPQNELLIAPDRADETAIARTASATVMSTSTDPDEKLSRGRDTSESNRAGNLSVSDATADRRTPSVGGAGPGAASGRASVAPLPQRNPETFGAPAGDVAASGDGVVSTAAGRGNSADGEVSTTATPHIASAPLGDGAVSPPASGAGARRSEVPARDADLVRAFFSR